MAQNTTNSLFWVLVLNLCPSPQPQNGLQRLQERRGRHPTRPSRDLRRWCGPSPSRRRVSRGRRRRPLRPPELDDDNAVDAAIVVGGSPSLRIRLRRYAPAIPQPDPVFGAVVGKRRTGSILTLGTPKAAVWAGIVVFVVPVVALVVVEEREGRRCGGVRVG